jgi:hypothetical protein
VHDIVSRPHQINLKNGCLPGFRAEVNLTDSLAFFGLALANKFPANTKLSLEVVSTLELKLMDSNITEPQYLGADLQLSEPHFEEEATLLSARSVVPLHEVKAKERAGRRLTFSLALIAALIVGALGATLIYKQRGQTPATATVETSAAAFNEVAPEASSTTPSGGATSDSAAATSKALENASEVSKREERNVAATRPMKPTALVVRSAGSAKETEITRDEDVNSGERKAERRAQRMEAWRLRREAEHQARREWRDRRMQRSDDLLRIREIFEGTRRP